MNLTTRWLRADRYGDLALSERRDEARNQDVVCNINVLPGAFRDKLRAKLPLKVQVSREYSYMWLSNVVFPKLAKRWARVGRR